MAAEYFSGRCQHCGGHLKVERLACRTCGVTLEGDMELPRLARLSMEEREFIELFVLSAGSLKEVGRILELSYPTVRTKLDKVIASLQALENERQSARMALFRQLENQEISADDAAKKLALL